MSIDRQAFHNRLDPSLLDKAGVGITCTHVHVHPHICTCTCTCTWLYMGYSTRLLVLIQIGKLVLNFCLDKHSSVKHTVTNTAYKSVQGACTNVYVYMTVHVHVHTLYILG